MKTIVATLNAKYIHMNLAIRYLKAYAEPEFQVELAEYTIKDPTMNIVYDIYQKNPDILGFSCYIWNIEETIRVIQILKKIKPTITIVLGGPEVSYDVTYWLKRLPEVDIIVMGEGEETFKELLETLHQGKSVEDVLGIAYKRSTDGRIVINPARKKIDLRQMPSPFRFKEDLPHLPNRIVYIETSRGCPFNCQFCLSSIEVGVRYFLREKIKEDIRYLMKNGARTIKFVDRTFNISRSYALEMFQFLIEEHVPGTVFQFEITGDIMRPEVIEFLNKNAPEGLFRFEIGVQSTNDLTNLLVKRKQNFEKLSRTVKMIKEGGKIVQHLDLIAGLPEEDYQSFRKTFNDVFALRPEELQLGFLKMLRGTGLRNFAKQWDYIYMDVAPYEILSNNCLDFADLLKIKQVEDILEKYWNAHRMDHTIEYIVTHFFETPFDFFQEFGTYWNQRGWAKIGHQLEDLFLRLDEFITWKNFVDANVVRGLMKIDYLMNYKYKPQKIWWEDRLKKEEALQLYQMLKETDQLPTTLSVLSDKDWLKKTIIEKIPFDVQHYMDTKTFKQTPSYFIQYYDGRGNHYWFSYPLSSKN